MGLRFELQEALDLPGNTVCYIDDLSITHSWYTIEDFNNKLHIQRAYGGMRIDGTVISIPIGNYNASRLASTTNDSVQQIYTDTDYPGDKMTCSYDSARGTIKITATFEFQLLSDFRTMSVTLEHGNSVVWVDRNDNETSIGVNNLYSINELLGNHEYEPGLGTTYESGFIDLRDVHSIFIHCPNLGHYNTVGVR